MSKFSSQENLSAISWLTGYVNPLDISFSTALVELLVFAASLAGKTCRSCVCHLHFPDHHIPPQRISICHAVTEPHGVKDQDIGPEVDVPTSRAADHQEETTAQVKSALVEFDDAFHASAEAVQINSLCLIQCIVQVLRKRAGISSDHDRDMMLQDWFFENTSRHLSYMFRHSKIFHEDGSLSLNELLNHA